ncbi:hypothetical protein BDB00DRAFT_808272 [Zychaea mexicana]|uniref:uncharacterized protein n=1 Tax=Zychaea mexicana TaxID=64656 RepID=UPI0022FF343F|nr:uncharacterized protein BDB00DRAFT_808272 [Zychaea mexicana]KAI9496669.1 hypothetical protein BDB00DRAFT_808272 [Zychaea mexicana]
MWTTLNTASYTVAFGETMPETNNHNALDDAVLAVLTDGDNFPPLQSSHTTNTAARLVQQNDEWQRIRSHDLESNDSLTVSSSGNDDSNSTYSDDDGNNDRDAEKSATTSWQRVNHKKKLIRSFAEIAARAGQINEPIPNECFFKQVPKRSALNKEKTVESEASTTAKGKHHEKTTTTEVHDDIYDAPFDGYDGYKTSRRTAELQKHRVLRHKQNLFDILFGRRMRAIPETLAKYEHRDDRAREKYKQLQVKQKEAATKAKLFPYWGGEKELFKNIDYNYVREVRRQQHKDKRIQISKAEFVRAQLLDEMERRGMLMGLPRSPEKRSLRKKQQKKEQSTRALEFQNPDVYLMGTSRSWQYYGYALAEISRQVYYQEWDSLTRSNNQYTKLVQVSALDGPRRNNAIVSLLHEMLPRNYYKPGQRKFRKQHIRYFVQNRDRFDIE